MPYKDKEKGRARARERRAKFGKEIDAKRKQSLLDKFNKMSPDEKQQFLDKRRAASLKSYYKHRDKIQAKAKQNRVHTSLKMYGLNLESYNEILKSQNSKCAICGCDGSDERRWSSGNLPFVVDHCHLTGIVRGLLCDACNVMLGHAYEKIDILKNAIAYLKKYEN